MFHFLTLRINQFRENDCWWEFCINEVDGKKFYFARNHNGRTHSFSNPEEQTKKIARFLQMGYTKCPYELLPA